MFVLNNAWIVAVVLFKWNFGFTESLECFTCTDARNLTECVTVKVCGQDEHCSTNVTGHGANIRYNLGCMNFQTCLGPVTTPSPVQTIVGRDVHNIVGRDVQTMVGRDVQTSDSNCHQCCDNNYCNKQICSHLVDVTTDPTCKNDADYNCELISSTFNICQDIHHAKVTCRKWCGLCGLVDGAWSDWTSWSNCDVTCSSGHKYRTRTCTNPKPEQGGLDCVGAGSETSTCTLQSCPVHGNWSSWLSWGSCSVSCGVGLQRRDRSCSNPYPGPQGNHCFGDARDDRVCFLKACADGNWSAWGSWSTCSITCGGGMKERNRNCDNPAPSRFGKACTGNDIMYVSCNTQSCPEPMVYFTVNNPTGLLVSARPIFSTVIANVGGAYNQTTGLFVCPISGLYQFYFSFMHYTGSDISCNLYHNKSLLTMAYSGVTTAQYRHTSAYVHVELKRGDTFYAGRCSGNWNLAYHGINGLFTGSLVHAS